MVFYQCFSLLEANLMAPIVNAVCAICLVSIYFALVVILMHQYLVHLFAFCCVNPPALMPYRNSINK